MSVTERKYLAIAIMFSLCAVFAGLLAGLAVAKYVMTAFMIVSTGACGYPVSYTHLTLPTIHVECRSRWSPYH